MVGFAVVIDFHSVLELHSFNNLGKVVEPSDPPPASLRTHSQFVQHRQHGVADHTALGLVTAVTIVAKVDSMGFVVRMCTLCSAGKS